MFISSSFRSSTAANFTSKLLLGKVGHARLNPVSHSFSYPIRYLMLDLSELHILDVGLLGFGYNRFDVCSIYDDDYLGKGKGTILDKVKELTQKKTGITDIGKVYLVTNPRYLGYVFNPVSFFWVYSSAGKLLAFIADVNNTFGDTHAYFVGIEKEVPVRFEQVFRQKKSFHVSPFFGIEGDYCFQFADILEEFAVRIAIKREEEKDFVAEVFGASSQIDRFSLLRELFVRPLTGIITFPRIVWQALRLKFQRKLAWNARPIPESMDTHTIRGAKLLERLALKIICKQLIKIKEGQITIIYPDNTSDHYGDLSSPLKATLYVKHYRLFTKILYGGDVAAGESYIAGDWKSDNLPALLQIFSLNRDSLQLRNPAGIAFSNVFSRLAHIFRSNTKSGSKKNIAAHYDLGNEMFKEFLDPTMTYSAALFDGESENLEEAQIRKLDRIIELANIKNGDNVLEIGCGWGSFAVRAAEKFGCRVTCLTLSTEQAAYARELVIKKDLTSKIEIKLIDYRDFSEDTNNWEKFDAVVSIEMIEAVGREYLPAYFKAIEKLMKSSAKTVIQAITLDNKRLDFYEKGCDFIQRYIFPGCYVPSIEVLKSVLESNTKLSWHSAMPFGINYAKTLKIWRACFLKNLKKKLPKSFIASWDYYFSYCEAGFRSGQLDCYKIVITKKN
jgi:cyclopropane-fatty-acyl-phospholipid synthase